MGGVASGGLPYTVAVGLAPVGPLQEEIEPRGFTGQNEFIEDAEPITAGFLRGHHVEGEFDLYSFTLEEPSWVTIEVSAFRNGAEEGEDSAFDPALLIYDSVGDFLFYNEDAFYYDPAISFLYSLPGTYYIEVTSFFGDRSSDYTLTLNAGPLGDGFESLSNDTAATADSLAYGEVIRGVYEGDPDLFAFEGSAGDMVRAWFYNSENHFLFDAPLTLTWLDVDGVTPLPFAPADAGEGGLNVARALLPADGTYYLAVDAPLGTATSVYGVRLEAVRDAAAVEIEPNDLTAEATPIPASGRVFGSIDATLDEDTYSFTAVAGEPVRIAVFADRSAFSDGFFFWSGHGSTLAPAIEIHDGTLAYSAASWAPLNGCVGAEGVSEGLATIEASFIAPSAGTYYVTIFSPFTLTVDDRPFYLLERR